MSEGHVSNEAPEIEPEKQSAKPAGVTPADQFVLPSLDQVWPMVMQIYSEVHGQFQGGISRVFPAGAVRCCAGECGHSSWRDIY